MRRPRRKLEVNTFPFLAVLLCAMGSFILLLMVIDRRAKIVAQNKARDDYLARKIAYEMDRDERAAAVKAQETKLQADWQAQKDRIHADLQAEEDALARQITDLLAALAKTDDHLAGQKSSAATLAQNVSAQDATLKALQKELQSRRNQLDQAKQTSQSHLKLREQLTNELVLLEAALRSVQERKARERPVYSLVPYKGKYGASSKPIYIEIGERVVSVHPGPSTLAPDSWTADELRRVIEVRTGPLEKEVVRKGLPPVENEKNPYLLFLVRPNGIPVYYEALQFLRGYRVDFGYELIEADWAFDFSTDKIDQQAWRNAAKLDIAPAQVLRAAPKGMGPRVLGPGGGEFSLGAASGMPSGPTVGLPRLGSGAAGALGGTAPGDRANRSVNGTDIPGGNGTRDPGSLSFSTNINLGGQSEQGVPGVANFGSAGSSSFQGANALAAPAKTGDSGNRPVVQGVNNRVGGTTYSPGNAAGSYPGVERKQPFAAAAILGPGGSSGENFGNRSGAVGAYSGPNAKVGLALSNESPNSGTATTPGSTTSNSGRSPAGTAATSGGNTGGFGGVGNGGGSPLGNDAPFPGTAFPPGSTASISGRSPNGTAATPGGITGGFGGAGNSGGSRPGSLESFAGSGAAGSDSPQSGQRSVAGNSPVTGQGGPSGAGASQSPGSPGGAQGGIPSLTFNLNGEKNDSPPPPRIEGSPPPRDNPLTFRNVPGDNTAPPRTGATNGSNGGNPNDAGEPGTLGANGSGSPGGDGSEAGPRVGGFPILSKEKGRASLRPPALGRITGNRDFVMTVECFEQKVSLSPPGKVFDLANPGAMEQLTNLMKTLVNGRQGTVRPGEPPYRPIVHFRVQPDGRRTYYSVYPRIAEFGFPMSRETPE